MSFTAIEQLVGVSLSIQQLPKDWEDQRDQSDLAILQDCSLSRSVLVH